jgi:glycosyltransferase involved in cell wall biosynthesis
MADTPRKIVIVSPAHPLRGGIAASSERLAETMQAAGHTVVIYSFSLQYPDFLFPGKTQFTDDPPPAGLTIRTRLNSVNPFNWLSSGWQIARERPDDIIVRFWLPIMGPCLGTVLRIARWVAGKRPRITALIDNIIPHEKRPGDRFFVGYFTGACDRFVVMSRSVETEMQQFVTNASAVRYAPHPIYDNYGDPIDAALARQRLSLPAGVPMVLFFGFIRAYKGLDLLLKALATTPGVHALVAGECYGDWDTYQQIIDAHGLADRVHLRTDFIPTDQVRLYFSASDLVVQPYKSATQSGISQIAYHFDKPMVVTNVGGLPEIVTNGVSGYVVEPAETAIADSIRDFFEHDRAAALIAGVRTEKERFSWGNLMGALLGG